VAVDGTDGIESAFSTTGSTGLTRTIRWLDRFN
jgi:hypothetical protein